MSLNFITHAVIGALFVAYMAERAWTRTLKAWPPDRQPMRVAVAGLLLVSIGGVGWAMAMGPMPWFYLDAPAGLYALAIFLGAWIRARSPQG